MYAVFKTKDNKWVSVPLVINPKNSITIKYKIYPEDIENIHEGKIKHILLVDYYKAPHKVSGTSGWGPVGEYARVGETLHTMKDNIGAMQYKGLQKTIKSVEAKDDIEIKKETGLVDGVIDAIRNFIGI